MACSRRDLLTGLPQNDSGSAVDVAEAIKEVVRWHSSSC